MRRLKERYIDTESIELRIIETEEVSQQKDEPLTEYLSRVRLGYPKEPENIVYKRLAWKFLSGILNNDIRSAVIKEKWINGQEAKPLEEILLIAETTRKALVATGQDKGTIGAVKRRSSDEFSTPSTPSSRTASGQFAGSSGSGSSGYARATSPSWSACTVRRSTQGDGEIVTVA